MFKRLIKFISGRHTKSAVKIVMERTRLEKKDDTFWVIANLSDGKYVELYQIVESKDGDCLDVAKVDRFSTRDPKELTSEYKYVSSPINVFEWERLSYYRRALQRLVDLLVIAKDNVDYSKVEYCWDAWPKQTGIRIKTNVKGWSDLGLGGPDYILYATSNKPAVAEWKLNTGEKYRSYSEMLEEVGIIRSTYREYLDTSKEFGLTSMYQKVERLLHRADELLGIE